MINALDIIDGTGCITCAAELFDHPTEFRADRYRDKTNLTSIEVDGSVHAIHKACKTTTKYTVTAEYHIDGLIVRWDSNGHAVPADVTALFYLVGRIDVDQMVHTDKARQDETIAAMAAYRAAQPATPTAEERFEAAAAFGTGVEVVDVVSGRTFTT